MKRFPSFTCKLIALALCFFPLTLMSQSSDNQWKTVDSLIDKQYYRQAYEKAEAIYNQALLQRDSRQSLLGACYLSTIGAWFMEDNADSSLVRYKSLLPSLKPVDQSICRLFLADFYAAYYSRNRWQINRNSPTDEADLDYKLWDFDRFRRVVNNLVREAFADMELLKATPLRSLGELVSRSQGKDGDLMPTLFDVAFYELRAITDYLPITTLQLSNLDNPELLFAETDRFVTLKVKPALDTATDFARFYLSLMQQYELFHSHGDNASLMVKRYCDRLDNLPRIVENNEQDWREYKYKELPKVVDYYRYSSGEQITLLLDRLSVLYYEMDSLEQSMAAIDTALALYPDSPGAVACYNRKQQILSRNIELNLIATSPSDRSQLVKVECRNVNRLYFRIVKDLNCDSRNDTKKCLLAQPVLKQWIQEVDIKRPYAPQHLFAVVPPLPQGDYCLIASADADFSSGLSYRSFSVEDIAVISFNGFSEYNACGLVVDRISGNPVANQTLLLQGMKNNKKQTISSCKSDADGFYHFAHNDLRSYENIWVELEYKGKKIKNKKQYRWEFLNYSTSENEQTYLKLFFDRPVYKPGDTVHFAAVAYNSRGAVNHDDAISIFLKDVNYQDVDSVRLKTDEYGTCNSLFVIPPDALPGRWRISASCSGANFLESIKIEAYKQPKFTVSLSKPNRQRRFGEVATVEGVAASYSAVPVSGANVEYQVNRRVMRPIWRWGWWNNNYMSDWKPVASGSLTTDDEGLFRINFIPMPDSTVNLKEKPSFEYQVVAKVTDLNGETHESSTLLSVGFLNSYLHIERSSISHDEISLTVTRRNLDGTPIAGQLSFELFLLQPPATPKLSHPMMWDQDPKPEMPLSRSEFERLFPLFDYDGSCIHEDQWPVQKRIFSTSQSISPDKPYIYDMKGLKAGVYKCVATSLDDSGDTISSVSFISFEPSDAKQPLHSNLLTVNVDKNVCEVGQVVDLCIGSPFKDVTAYVIIRKDSVDTRIQTIRLNNEFRHIPIAITDKMLGGIIINVLAVLENTVQLEAISINVPYSHKQLDVTLETFRNKLEPGDNEQWTLRIKEQKTGFAAKANLLMTMFDRALEQYGKLSWYLNPWNQRYPYYIINLNGLSDKEYGYFYFQPQRDYKSSLFYQYSSATFKNGLYSGDFDRIVAAVAGVGYGRNTAMKGNLRKRTGVAVDEEDEEEVFLMVEDAAVSNEAALSKAVVKAEKVPVIEVGAPESGMSLEDMETTSEANPLYLRQNLSTLAFFKPALRSSDDGSVSLSFTAPDLLTEWSIQGLAWTPDLKVGSLSTSAITQKRLMVTPNVPRFLRHGDTCRFSVKVSNLSGNEQDIAVSLALLDPSDNALLQMIVGDTVKHIQLASGASGEVLFVIAVPQAPLFLVNYRLIARGQGCSDGEQGPIPLLPSRQLVTESMAFYINGVGEKHYEMSHLSHLLDVDTADLTLSNYSLTVDLTPNPIWLALQALPYVCRNENPSNIYLANSIYTNSLSLFIVKGNPLIERLFNSWRQHEPDAFQSALDRNSDLKQTVMEETPWLQDALNEEQRHREVARFFTPLQLERQLQKDIDKLLQAQRSDGGWSWIPGGHSSSLYTTQYILKTLGLLQQQGVKLDLRTQQALDRALSFVDSETYQYYKRYLKGHSFEPVNLDYLYLRSYFPDNKLGKKHQEAYDFFYSNAKKHNSEYRSLFSQAQLALVFHRNGDTKMAREMVTRIQQKALYSDEMGMYWRDNKSGWCWYERPIETQALLIRLFDEVNPDHKNIALMQQWLLKQKQTTNWNTDVATVNAIQALLIGSGDNRSDVSVRLQPSQLSVQFGNHQLKTDTTLFQLHLSHRLDANQIQPADGKVLLQKNDPGIAWGALYWQYFEQVDKIPSSSSGITLRRSIYLVNNDGSLSLYEPASSLRVGQRIRLRLEIYADRDLEYLELKEPRCAALEPVNTQSGWVWNAGLSFYRAVTNAAQTLYIDRIDKGHYIAESDYYVNNAGSFRTAPTVLQCLYAPEFRAVLPMPTLSVDR